MPYGMSKSINCSPLYSSFLLFKFLFISFSFLTKNVRVQYAMHSPNLDSSHALPFWVMALVALTKTLCCIFFDYWFVISNIVIWTEHRSRMVFGLYDVVYRFLCYFPSGSGFGFVLYFETFRNVNEKDSGKSERNR